MYIPLKRTFTANLIIGAAIALFVYFLKQSALLEFLLAHAAELAARLYLTLALNRPGLSSSPLTLLGDALCILVAAALWTYLKSTLQRLAALFCLGVLLLPVSVAVYRAREAVPTAPLIVWGVALAIAVEALAHLLSSGIRTRIVDEKQEAEFGILGHLTHNVKPNIQMARSPLTAVLDFLEARGASGEVLAKRLDGSDETVGDALQKALLSLEQIGSILESTRKLVTSQIRREEFGEVAVVDLIAREIAPLYADRLRIAVSGDPQLTLRLHRESFTEAINNLVRNALTHAFADAQKERELLFAVRETRNWVNIDYTNNGRPFPKNLDAKEFLTPGRKSHDSPGEGLGGAWIGKVVAAHHGSFEIIRDENPLHFRITLPKRGI